jgi:hypothetical protein
MFVLLERDRLVLSALPLILAGGFTWMGLWALRGRETYGPDIDQGINPNETPVRGRAARFTGVAFLVFAAGVLGALIVQWR